MEYLSLIIALSILIIVGIASGLYFIKCRETDKKFYDRLQKTEVNVNNIKLKQNDFDIDACIETLKNK